MDHVFARDGESGTKPLTIHWALRQLNQRLRERPDPLSGIDRERLESLIRGADTARSVEPQPSP
ncbi:hypothetical protein [Halocatena pleomorpha]|uniref:Uncharacterized protein n=1 Tax=Halocatena pleomorpha TaxID=1785090 RepID=A0A3P3R7F9_9EURY|nr:hypothetical protein [Halocatena pleomorpha]RRJ29401.1 hypothetical protein EIK79_12205 [Halocatena pleomorpha]